MVAKELYLYSLMVAICQHNIRFSRFFLCCFFVFRIVLSTCWPQRFDVRMCLCRGHAFEVLAYSPRLDSITCGRCTFIVPRTVSVSQSHANATMLHVSNEVQSPAKAAVFCRTNQ